MYKHILIATDGSRVAGKALDQGLALAGTLGARITVVTVSELFSRLGPESGSGFGLFTSSADLRSAFAAAAQKTLDAARVQAEQAGVACEAVHVADKVPADGIIQTAEERKCDLIVVASHGGRGVARLLLGSVASEVASRASVPVLIVR